MRYLYIIFLFLLLPITSSAESVNAGFVQGIWYAHDPVLADTPTRIYIALRNNTEHDLSGTIRFTENGTRIGSSQVHALSGRLVEAWVDWMPSFGTHSIAATISNAELHIIGGGTESIDISGIVAESILFVDKDTDGDGIGDAEDTDDDNDTISDIDEENNGTDPLSADLVSEETESTPAQEETEDTTPSEPAQGLEQYIDENTSHTIIQKVTKKIEEAKTDLDEYRESRTLSGTEETATAGIQELSQPTGTGTEITRTTTEVKKGIFEKLIDGFILLFHHLWSFVLWLTSVALGAPVLIEIIGLALILYIILRTARRLARRPQP